MSYPSRAITGAIVPPTAVAAATALPEIAPKSIDARMFTCASPPGKRPIAACASAMSRRAMPPRFMSCPASTKNGIASSVNESSPVAMRCATVVTAGPGRMLSSIASAVDAPML